LPTSASTPCCARIGRLGLCGALAYAYSLAFFASSTVVYALAAGRKNWAAITHVFGGWLTVHGDLDEPRAVVHEDVEVRRHGAHEAGGLVRRQFGSGDLNTRPETGWVVMCDLVAFAGPSRTIHPGVSCMK
jgi:hypothetical protein